MNMIRFANCLCLLALVGCTESTTTQPLTESILPTVENQTEILEQVSDEALGQTSPGAAPIPPAAKLATHRHMAPPEINFPMPKLPDTAVDPQPTVPWNATPQTSTFAALPSLAPSTPVFNPDDPLNLQIPHSPPLPMPTQTTQFPMPPMIGPPANLANFGPPVELQKMSVDTLRVRSALPDKTSALQSE